MKPQNLIPVFFALMMICALPAQATHDIWYFVWHQDEYVQGMWKRAGMLPDRSPRYLRPVLYVDMLGTVPLDLVQHIMGRLKAQRPEAYAFDYEADVAGDTVVMKLNGSVPDFNTIKNEVTLSMVMQSGFDHVRFVRPEGTKTYSVADIDLPWFDLRRPGGGFASDTEEGKVETEPEETDTTGDEEPEPVAVPQSDLPDTSRMEEEGGEGDEEENDSFPWLTVLLPVVAGGIGFALGRVGKKEGV